MKSRPTTGVRVMAMMGTLLIGGMLFSAQGVAANLSTPPGTPPTWSRVGESVSVDVNADGKVAGAPTQATTVTAATDSALTVSVPVSGTPNDPTLGKPTEVVDGAAQFHFTPSGTSTQTVTSDYTKTLPLSVTPTYLVNGTPTTAADLASSKPASGTLKASYVIANTTSQTTTVSFSGFNGAPVTQTVTQPIPIAVSLNIKFPKDTSGIDAPGASFSAGVTGVDASWTLMLAPPLGDSTQTVTYTIDLAKVRLLGADLRASVIQAPTATGQLPAETAAAIASAKGTAEAAAQAAYGQAQVVASGAMANVQHALTQLTAAQESTQSSDRTSSDSGSSDLYNTSQAILGQLSGQLATSGNSSEAGVNSSVDALRQAFNGASSKSFGVGVQSAQHASNADALNGPVGTIATQASELNGLVVQHLVDVKALQAQIDQSITDLALFPDHSPPQWVQLAADLAAAKVKATIVVTAATLISQKVAALQAAIGQLQSAVAALAGAAHALTSAAADAWNNLISQVGGAVNDLQTKLVTVQSQIKDYGAEIQAGTSQLALLNGGGRSSISSTRGNGDSTVSTKGADAQAVVNSATSQAEQKLAAANNAYAQYIAIGQIGHLHQLPGGNATGATDQSGVYAYTIAGS